MYGHSMLYCVPVFLSLFCSVLSACVPDFSSRLLSDPAILQHPAVVEAFREVERNLSALFTGNTKDGLSFAVVHASSQQSAFTYNNGPRRFNETSTGIGERGGSLVDSDSVFRVASVSKNIATFSTLVVENESRQQSARPILTIDTTVRQTLPSFRLPDIDWQNGGSEITLSMLGTHSSGLPREGYETDYNMVIGLAKATSDGIGAKWASVTPESLVESFRNRNLMFAPGQRAAYSNAGICLLAFAVVNHHNLLTSSNQTWTQFATSSILQPLNMTHSFFGPIPSNFIPNIVVPGSDNWVDLLIGPGYDPAGGMWSSANDLVQYLSNLLSPTPQLITPLQRRTFLTPGLSLPDGNQQVGFGWELSSLLPLNSSKPYTIYGKSGDAGGFHSWIDLIPNLGYGLVILTAESQNAATNYTRLVPTSIRDSIHAILAPAFATALSSRLASRYTGTYSSASDTGLIAEQVSPFNSSAPASRAKMEVVQGQLFLRSLVINGTSALEALDRLSWTDASQGRFFSTPAGVGLNPAEGAGENAQYGPGAQVWRMIPDLERCDWFDFDGYVDVNAWPLSKIVTVEDGRGGVEVRYPPFDVVLKREG
ncbi:Beta-lactamase-like protein 1 [Elsinoe fawcettii]|nr:Beta-lactamase-like protein 1 [Elsinoe fawcettii]